MTVEDEEESTRRFLQHFFSLLDVREPRPASLAQGEGEEVAPLLQLKQRNTIGRLLPEWVRLLHAQATERRETGGGVGRSNPRGGAAAATSSSSYLDGDMAESWFAFPHLALISSPWARQRVPPPLDLTRHRLLHHLQQRYECGAGAGGGRGAFVQNLLRSLSQHGGADGRGVEQLAFIQAVNSLFPQHPSSRGHQQPPVELVAAALFSEWCAVAADDASFASTRVPLQVIVDDLAAYRPATKSPAPEADGGATTMKPAEPGVQRGDGGGAAADVVVGTLAGLACAYPMATAAWAGGDRRRLAARPARKRGRGADRDDEEEEEEEEEDDDYGWNGSADGDDTAEDEEDNTSSHMSDGNDEGRGSRRRRMNAFVRRNTTAFRVPLASLLLNVFNVRQDGTGDAVVARHVTPARGGEAHFRRGELLWFSVGESKRHRSMLESK
ncbi:uncharacterized protein Tco025E_05068 [Trypanosoma conorhini]|uniref:Uncharacterized protein n=1 Tax=Trypanosoma conorhini TaxID=83891 RepID=A0A422PH77_9TRYP|nr:uncharacterized protein Tco025E_05068 [Trypanosoma conorhini]RNF17082.1 hypothetical protein Tco025E_05068 [Trypanosoma conorhini]